MPFDPQQFKILADWLVGEKTDEASFRTAISRIYYAAHLRAREGLIRKRPGVIPSGNFGSIHSTVIRGLRHGPTNGISRHLDALRKLREHADYHLDSAETIFNEERRHCERARQSASDPVSNQDWQNACEISDRLFPLLETL